MNTTLYVMQIMANELLLTFLLLALMRKVVIQVPDSTISKG